MGPLNHESEPWLEYVHPVLQEPNPIAAAETVLANMPVPFWKQGGTGMKQQLAKDMFHSVTDIMIAIMPAPWITSKMRIFAVMNIYSGVSNIMSGKTYTSS